MAETQNTTETKKQTMSIHTILYTLLIAAVAYLGYIYYLETSMAAKHRPKSVSCMAFEQLPGDVQALYVSAADYNQLKNAHEDLVAEYDASQNQAVITKEESAKEEAAETVREDMNRDSVQDQMTEKLAASGSVKRIKEFAKCYDMDSAAYKISPQCRKDIIDYVDRHKDAKYFEIIGIVDNLEFNLFNNLERNKKLYRRLGVDQRVVDKMKKLTRRGLSKERASEASWVIKVHTKRQAATYNANYELVSEKGHKGVVIRAYK